MLTYAIILLLVGVALIIMELFLPSAGILGALATGAIIGSLVLAFKEGEGIGLVFLGLTVIIVPVLLVMGLKIFPKTPIGRRIILPPVNEPASVRGQAGVSMDDYRTLVGKNGQTVTPLRPSGIAEIEGERYSVVSEGELIEDNTKILVVEIQGNSIVVEEL